MFEDTKSWMKKLWSIRIELIGQGSGHSTYTIYSSAKPFLSTPDEAQQVLEDLRSKIMSICVSSQPNLTPLVTYEREAGGDMGSHISHYVRDGSHDNKVVGRRWFRPVVDEVVVPAEVLRRSLVRLSLLEEF